MEVSSLLYLLTVANGGMADSAQMIMSSGFITRSSSGKSCFLIENGGGGNRYHSHADG